MEQMTESEFRARYKKSLRTLQILAGVSMTCAMVTIFVIGSGIPSTDSAKLLTLFFLLGFASLSLASLIGILYLFVQKKAFPRLQQLYKKTS
jgi:hypothetical protein